MVKATWNGKVIAKSDNCKVIEGNYYFPPESINKEFLKVSKTETVCPWKGTASYYSLEVDGEINKDAAWYYENPKEEAKEIKNHVAFWKGVRVE